MPGQTEGNGDVSKAFTYSSSDWLCRSAAREHMLLVSSLNAQYLMQWAHISLPTLTLFGLCGWVL